MSVLVHPFYKPPRDTCCSGMALIFTLAPGVEVLHDVSHSRSVPLFSGAGCVCLGWKHPRLFESRPLSLLWGRRFLLCGVVVFLAAVAGELEYLWACLAKATFIIIRWMCTPERPSQNHPESSYWKQRWGPFSRRWSYVRPFLFLDWSAQALHTNERTFVLFVFSGETLVEKAVLMCESSASPRAERGSQWRGPTAGSRLYIELQVWI